jgi:uncharacterized peroxidase-related enzyme
MVEFTFYDEDTAPAAAKPCFERAKKETGRLPNIYRYMAESPQLLEGYQQLRLLFRDTSLSPVEQELVLLAVNFEHGCTYCMAVHSARAKMAKMDAAVLAALRAGTAVPDEKLEALRIFTRKMVRERAWVTDADLEEFLAAGYTRQNALEIVLAIGMKVLTTYANHLFDAPLDAALAPFAWSRLA